MALTLSTTELERLEACLDTLMSPLAHPTVDGWRADVNLRVRELLGADLACFVLSDPGCPHLREVPLVYTDDLDSTSLATYQAYLWDDAGTQKAEAIGLSAMNQATLIVGDEARFDSDPMVNAFYRPLGIRDAIACFATWPHHGSAAFIELGRDRFGTDLFGEKGLALLRLLRPALKAGVRALSDARGHPALLGGLLDHTGQMWFVFDDNGTLLHATPAAVAGVAADPDGESLRQSVLELARTAGARHAARRTPRLTHRSDTVDASIVAPYRVVATASAHYVIRATCVEAETIASRATVLVAVESRNAAIGLSDSQLADQYRLTPREIQVARLLANRRSDKEVAATLGISIHTARRHTERVFAQLGVHARAEVASKLASSSE